MWEIPHIRLLAWRTPEACRRYLNDVCCLLLPAFRQSAGSMKYSKYLNPVQVWPDPVGDNITCIGDNQFACAVNPARVAECRVLSQKVDRVINTPNHQPGGGGVILRDKRGFIIKVVQGFVEPLNLH